MDTTTNVKPKSMAELLPGLSGILSKDKCMQSLTAKKQPRQTIAHSRTTEKGVPKPLTIAEMRADILALKVHSPKSLAQRAATSKKIWNSSIKVNKTVSHTANGKIKHNTVRKVLNFQPKPKPVSNVRATMAPEPTKFPKPEVRSKKSLFVFQARNTVRISGINNIAETPVVNRPIIKSRMTLANKDNVAMPEIKNLPLPKSLNKKNLIPIIPDTPLSNDSWKSSCDASFLQKEKEINEVEEKTKAISNEQTLDNIAEVTPPISTPFQEYRNVKEYFNNSSELENSVVYHDNTITCFNKLSDCKENNKREESVIVSLCELLNKASVTNSGKMSTELEDLLKFEKQTEHNLRMIDNSIDALKRLRVSHLTTLQCVRKLINDKKPCEIADRTLTNNNKSPKAEKLRPERKPVISSKPCSVIKSCAKSPTYVIPKKNPCMRKKVFYKSMPNVSNDMVTPVKADMGHKALSVYMKMKEHMDFLNTPVAKRDLDVPNTPAVTSHNLQKQLDKLYDEN